MRPSMSTASNVCSLGIVVLPGGLQESGLATDVLQERFRSPIGSPRPRLGAGVRPIPFCWIVRPWVPTRTAWTRAAPTCVIG